MQHLPKTRAAESKSFSLNHKIWELYRSFFPKRTRFIFTLHKNIRSKMCTWFKYFGMHFQIEKKIIIGKTLKPETILHRQ